MDEEILKLALKSQKPDAIMAAKYLEGKGLVDKAITVYHAVRTVHVSVYSHSEIKVLYKYYCGEFQAGRVNKATDLAFTQGYYGNIETISNDINENSDPQLIERCVEYFSEHNQVDRAVNILVKAKRVSFCACVLMNLFLDFLYCLLIALLVCRSWRQSTFA